MRTVSVSYTGMHISTHTHTSLQGDVRVGSGGKRGRVVVAHSDGTPCSPAAVMPRQGSHVPALARHCTPAVSGECRHMASVGSEWGRMRLRGGDDGQGKRSRPLRLSGGGAPARMPNFHGQRRAAPRVPPPDLASAVAAIIGLDPAPPGAGAGQAAGRAARGAAAAGNVRGRAAGRGRGAGATRRGTKRGGAAVAVGARPVDSDSEGSPAKKSRLSESTATVAATEVGSDVSAAISTVPAPAPAPAEERDADTAGEIEDSFSQVSSIEVELPAHHPQLPGKISQKSAL